MYEKTLDLWRKWKFKKLRAEVTLMQVVIVNEFKDYMRHEDIHFTIDDYRPPVTKNKEERINAILEPRYANKTIVHYRGGHIQTLEEELVVAKPEHDDIKDSLSSVIE